MGRRRLHPFQVRAVLESSLNSLILESACVLNMYIKLQSPLVLCSHTRELPLNYPGCYFFSFYLPKISTVFHIFHTIPNQLVSFPGRRLFFYFPFLNWLHDKVAESH